MKLHRFWFKFLSTPQYTLIQLGCGVTAHSYDDAIEILQKTVFAGKELPAIAFFKEDVDISELDQKHVVPNMELPVWRGVWFPKGFTQI